MYKSWILLAAASAMMAGAPAARADVYEWVDANGKKHYTDKPSKAALAGEGQSLSQVAVKTNTYEAPEAPSQDVAKAKQVELYATSWCGYCRKARQHFAREGIAYIEYDIEKDAAANARHKALGGRGVPLILVDGRKMNGFSEEGFARIYASE